MSSLLRNAVFGIVAASAATFAKTRAEETLQPLMERLVQPSPAAKTGIGADPAGHPENMPPGEVADRALHVVTGDQLTDEQRTDVSDPLHWIMGIGAGTAYAIGVAELPELRTGRGALAGLGLFAATHLSTLPAAGVQHPPTRMPRAWWGWEAGSHVVYGVVLDTALRLLDGAAGRQRPR